MFAETEIMAENLRSLEGGLLPNASLDSIYSVLRNFSGKSHMIRYHVIRIQMWYTYIFSDVLVFIYQYIYNLFSVTTSSAIQQSKRILYTVLCVDKSSSLSAADFSSVKKCAIEFFKGKKMFVLVKFGFNLNQQKQNLRFEYKYVQLSILS